MVLTFSVFLETGKVDNASDLKLKYRTQFSQMQKSAKSHMLLIVSHNFSSTSIHSCFSAIFTKGDNFCDFLYATLD